MITQQSYQNHSKKQNKDMKQKINVVNDSI